MNPIEYKEEKKVISKSVLISIKNTNKKQLKVRNSIDEILEQVQDLTLELTKSQQAANPFVEAEKTITNIIKKLTAIKIKVRRNKRTYNTLEAAKNHHLKELMKEFSLKEINKELSKL